MMPRFPFLCLGLFLFGLLNLPQERMDRMRAGLSGLIRPLWQMGVLQGNEPPDRDVVTLHLLQQQVDELKHYLGSHVAHSEATPARVLFRDPSLWSSTIWVGLGNAHNGEQTLIGKNSPVLLGNSLIGVVEYVGTKQSRVRLITDTGFTISVRAIRGTLQNREFLHHLTLTKEHGSVRDDLFLSEEEKSRFVSVLSTLEKRLQPTREELLAKGELHGHSSPLWRSSSPILTGIGFNYDFSDEVGSAQELRSCNPLLKKGDLLATSGLDGLFPSGIPVAIVSKIKPLEEGDYFYTLEAQPTAGTLQDLHVVFILPPHET